MPHILGYQAMRKPVHWDLRACLQDKPRTRRPVREGTDVGWTSGIVGPDAEESEEEKPTAADKKVRRYHVVTSAQGSAVHWQARVHYYW